MSCFPYHRGQRLDGVEVGHMEREAVGKSECNERGVAVQEWAALKAVRLVQVHIQAHGAHVRPPESRPACLPGLVR